MAMSSVGTANKVIGVESARPPITARARGRCSSLPAPMPRARGSRPNRVHSVVIRIGRRRTRARSEEHTLNSSHGYISYAVFCLKKKKKKKDIDIEREKRQYQKQEFDSVCD